jgi:cytochrome c biogenesis protein CcmG, thiol:disulfide interchange protein DsbE
VTADANTRRPVRSVIATAAVVAVPLAFVALIADGLLARAPNTAIDDRLAQRRGAPVPAFTLDVLTAGAPDGGLREALGDHRLSPSELSGQPYVLNLWASWCDPCCSEATLLARAAPGARRRGVRIIGIDQQDVTSDARRFLAHYRISYPVVRDPGDAVARSFGATGVPETYFVDARGEVVDHVIGAIGAAQLGRGLRAAATGRPLADSQGGDREALR